MKVILTINRYVFSALFGAGVLFSLPVKADTPPIPAKKQNLADIEKSLEEERNKAAQKEKDIESASLNLEKLQKKLVGFTAQVQKTQDELGKLQKQLLQLEHQEKELEEIINKDQVKMAEILSALLHIHQTPMPAMIFHPSKPIDTARTLSVLETTFPAIKKEAEEFRIKLTELKKLKSDVATKTVQVEDQEAKLSQEKAELEKLIRQRQAKLDKDRKLLSGHISRTKQLAQQAENLEELIKKVEEDRKRVSFSFMGRSAGKPITKPVISKELEKPSRHQNLPIPGIVKVNFGDKDAIGATSQGLRIIGKDRMPVVSPLDGVVRFTGHFKNYGEIVIIEHHGNYHSLLGGLDRIDVQVGQDILSGEPVGILPKKDGQNPVLYFELRYNGEPINPAVKLKSLG